METATDDGHRPGILHRILGDVPRSLGAVLLGTFTLRFSTGLTGTLLIYYLADLPTHGGPVVDAAALGLMTAAFYAVGADAGDAVRVAVRSLGSPPGDAVRAGLRVRRGDPDLPHDEPAAARRDADPRGRLDGGVGPVDPRVHRGDHRRRRAPPRSCRGPVRGGDAGRPRRRGRRRRRRSGTSSAPVGFLLNAGIYVVSFLIYRFGVPETPGDTETTKQPHPGSRRYIEVLRSSHVWLLAPTWIAVNAAIGLWTTQSLFQLVKEPAPKFADQFLMGRADPIMISVGFVLAGIVFFAGLAYWGERFRTMRRTTILFYGILGGGACVVAVAVINHSLGLSPVVTLAAGAVVIAGLFVLAGATPAALGMLADISEAFPADRGAIMGLYSVFLALGQIIGSLVGGFAADWRGIDGILIATMLALVIALIPLGRLRTVEHLIDGAAEGQVALG